MRVFARLLKSMCLSTVLLGFVGAATVVVPAIASAAPTFSPVVGHVYVNDNTAGTNTIGAFNRHADGSLTSAPGSPFNADGAGNGGGLASQGAIQITGNGRYVLAVDAGSNQISVLRINFDGSLSVDSVVSSDGQLPVSVAVHHHLVYVANASPTSPNYTGFTLNHGRLAPLPRSTVVLANGAQPADVLFNGNGQKLVGTEAGSGEIDSFTVRHDGLLAGAPGSPFPAQGVGPFGSEFSPTNPNQLFVSNAHNDVAADTTGHGTVSAFDDSPNGVLLSIGSSPFADLQTAPCWIEITHDGRFLFTVNTGSGEISRYSIGSGGTLKLLGSTPVGAIGGVGAVDARLSPDGRTLYVDESRIGEVGEFAVNGGNLTERAGSPVSLPTTGTAGIATN
jgi:6-phosphogluconolactonase (cycloisomerase 2 family)